MIKNKLKLIVGRILINCTCHIYRYAQINKFGYFINRIFKKVLYVFQLSYFPIESILSYKSKFNNLNINNISPTRDGVFSNVIMNGCEEQHVLSHVTLPAIRLINYRDVFFTSNSDVIVDLNNKCIINDYCYNIDNNIAFIDGLLYRQKLNIGILRNNFSQRENSITSGIMVSGKFSNNYYHAVYDNLCRLLFIDSAVIPTDIPLIVDEVVFDTSSLKQIFEILVSNLHRSVLIIKKKCVYHCENLYSIDHINQIAPHLKDISIKGRFFVYDIEATKTLKQKLLVCKQDKDTPQNIFISRKNTKRRNFNEEEVFHVLEKYGFVTIIPENFSFEEQVTFFNNAKWIIGGIGAAFTNLLFCKEGCNIITLVATNHTPSVFNTIAYINKCKMWYYVPNNTKSMNNVHSDYYIDIKHFEKYISELLGKNLNNKT